MGINAKEMRSLWKKNPYGSTYELLVDWCYENRKNIDLKDPDVNFLYETALTYLTYDFRLAKWNENDIIVLLYYFVSFARDKLKIQDSIDLNIVPDTQFYKKGEKEDIARCSCHNDGSKSIDLPYKRIVETLRPLPQAEINLGIFNSLGHEIIHINQMQYIMKPDCISPEYYIIAMEQLVSKIVPIFYKTEYENLLMESQADSMGYDIAENFFESWGTPLTGLSYWSYKIQSDISKEKYSKKIDQLKDRESLLDLLEYLTTTIVGIKPELLNTFPILTLGFNSDGTKKSLEQLLEDKKRFIKKGVSAESLNSLYNVVCRDYNFSTGIPVKRKSISIQEAKDNALNSGTTSSDMNLLRYFPIKYEKKLGE